MRETLNQEAINAFNGSTENQPINSAPKNAEVESNDSVGSNISNNSEQNQSMDYSSENIDDDIPF